MKNLLYTLIVLFSIYSCGNGTKKKDTAKKVTAIEELNSISKEKKIYDFYTNQLNEFTNKEKNIRKRIKTCRAQKQKDSVDYLFKILNEGMMKSYKFTRVFIEKNSNTLVGAYVFANSIGKFHTSRIFNEKEIFEIYKGYHKLPKGKVSEMLSKKINILKALQPGQKAPMINLQDTTGNKISLNDFKGKYIIIDFWASWCCGCRQESPNLARIYKDFKSKGLEILGVSFDKNMHKWIEAIVEDKLVWPQVCDFDGMRSKTGNTYNLAYIPQLYIIDREGNIVCKGLRGKQLYNKIKELLAK